MFRAFALVLILASVACGSPSAPSPSRPTSFLVVNQDGQPLSGIAICPGETCVAVTSATGEATVTLSAEAFVRFQEHGQTRGGHIYQPGTTNRVVLP